MWWWWEGQPIANPISGSSFVLFHGLFFLYTKKKMTNNKSKVKNLVSFQNLTWFKGDFKEDFRGNFKQDVEGNLCLL